MAELFIKTIDSSSSGGTQVIDFRVPAFSKKGARRRAETGARIKGVSSAEVVEMRELEGGNVPGQKVYRVTVEGRV